MKKVHTKFASLLLVLSLLFASFFSTISTSLPVFADPIPSNATPSTNPDQTTPDNLFLQMLLLPQIQTKLPLITPLVIRELILKILTPPILIQALRPQVQLILRMALLAQTPILLIIRNLSPVPPKLVPSAGLFVQPPAFSPKVSMLFMVLSKIFSALSP